MPSWEDRFVRHTLWTAVEELRAALDGLELPEDDGDRDAMEFTRAFAERLASYRREGNPLDFTVGSLARVEAAVRIVVATFNEWVDDTGDSAELIASVDAAIDSMSGWPRPTLEQVDGAAGAAASRVSEAASSAITAMAETRDRLDAGFTEIQEQAAETVAALAALSSDMDGERSKQAAAAKTARDKLRRQAEATIKDLAELRTQAKNMLHETTSFTVAAEYADYAKERAKSAKAYDIAAVIFGSAGLVSVGLYLFEKGTATTSVSLAITRLGVTLGALVIGGLLATRGADQHKEAREANRTSLALSRLAPFIANLEEDAREVLTIETADRIFTRGHLGESASSGASVLAKLEELRAKSRLTAADVADSEV